MRLGPDEARFLAAATLGIPAQASLADAKAAWIRLVQETHPDRGGDPDRFQAVQAAWDVWQLLERRSTAPNATSRSSETPAPTPYATPREPAPRVIRRHRVAEFDVHTQRLPDLSARQPQR